jgi:hypothetical protein
MTAFTTLILASLIVSISIVSLPTLAYGEPSVGVKKGDWIEYAVSVTGDTPPPKLNINSFRIEILDVEGAAFQANFTTRFVNGTISSSIWKFNFTEGQVEGWVIIPQNLGVGSTFYDSSKPANVTIEGEQQKIVAGASRTITQASDAKRLVKEWDKATGVYTYSVEHPKNLTLTSTAVATNMWSSEILGLNQTTFYALVSVSAVLAATMLSSAVVVARRKRLALSSSSEGKIAVFTGIAVVFGELGTLAFFPFLHTGLSFAELNLIIQTFWTALVLVSMGLRMKGKYFAHELTMIAVICATLTAFSTVLIMSPMDTSSISSYFNSPLRWVMNSLHGIFSIPALIFAAWLVALWRPNSSLYPAKSKRIAQLTTVFWVASYLVGVFDFILLHTTILG